MGNVIKLYDHKVIAKCGCCKKDLYEEETFYQAPGL